MDIKFVCYECNENIFDNYLCQIMFDIIILNDYVPRI